MSHLRDSPPTPGTRLPLTYETRLTPGSPSVHARRFPAPGRSLIHQNDHADITVHLPVLPKKNVSSPRHQPPPPPPPPTPRRRNISLIRIPLRIHPISRPVRVALYGLDSLESHSYGIRGEQVRPQTAADHAP